MMSEYPLSLKISSHGPFSNQFCSSLSTNTSISLRLNFSDLLLPLETFNKEDIFIYSSFLVKKFLYPAIRQKKIYSSSSSRMGDTPMSYNSSGVKSINLKWLYFHSACPSSSDLLNAWILFGLSISTMTS